MHFNRVYRLKKKIEYTIRIFFPLFFFTKAVIPPCCSNGIDSTTEHKAMVMWSPHPQLSDKK